MSVSTFKIITNNVPRDIINWYDLTEKEKKEFDWIHKGTEDEYNFVRFNGNCYATNEFMQIDNNNWDLKGWHDYIPDTYFSGVLIKYVNDYEQVVMGRYYQ